LNGDEVAAGPGLTGRLRLAIHHSHIDTVHIIPCGMCPRTAIATLPHGYKSGRHRRTSNDKPPGPPMSLLNVR